MGSASAQVEALRADLEKAEAQLAEAQAQLLSMRKARLEEAESAAAQLRAFKVRRLLHHFTTPRGLSEWMSSWC